MVAQPWDFDGRKYKGDMDESKGPSEVPDNVVVFMKSKQGEKK